MDIWSWLKQVALLIVVYEITSVEGDLLESFRPRADNPPELNDFLNNVLEHRRDFSFARKAARKYQKTKKGVRDLDELDAFDSLDPFPRNWYDRLKNEDKRSVHHYNPIKRFKNFGKTQSTMHNKFRRHINEKKNIPRKNDIVKKRKPKMNREKHIPSQIYTQPKPEPMAKRFSGDVEVEPEGESGRLDVEMEEELSRVKKQVPEQAPGVHRTYKNTAKIHTQLKTNKGNDYYYVDLQNEAEKNRDRYNDKRRYDSMPQRPNYLPFAPNGQDFQRPRERNEYIRNENPDFHHSLNDEVAFEKAQSYEIQPKPENNPNGNNLYGVDAGQPEMIQPLNQPPIHPQEVNEQPINRQETKQSEKNIVDPLKGQDGVTNERFYIDSKEHLQKIDTTTEAGDVASSEAFVDKKEEVNNDKKLVKHVNGGFIEITKASLNGADFPKKAERETLDDDDDDDGNDESEKKQRVRQKSSILTKNSLHPLRVKNTQTQDQEDASDEDVEEPLEDEERYTGRKLQFIDDEMSNLYNQDEDQDYETLPNRGRRDFLDALGMKNEEDYSEDNPYKESMEVNNTDVRNDTHIHNHTSSTEICHLVFTTKPKPTTKRPTKFTTNCQQRESIRDIHKILEEPKELTEVTMIGDFRKSTAKRGVKRSSKIEDFEVTDDRKARDTSEDVETKIFMNKERIFNPHEAFNNNRVHENPQEQTAPKLKRNSVVRQAKNNVKKSVEPFEDVQVEKVDPTCETTPLPNAENCTKPEVSILGISNSTYDQMDAENEKMAQIVNGQLASKIVSSVFEELKKKSSLKAKFAAGLSRKHVGYAGSNEFDFFKANESEDANEARLFLSQITKVLNKLVLNQVRSKSCERLPPELKNYLDNLLEVKGTPEIGDYVPNTQQGNFLFNTNEENKEVTTEPQFDPQKLEATLLELERLLLSYHNMNEECQSRAEAVKEYIEEHVKMLQDIVKCPDHSCAESKRNTPQLHRVLVEKQLESVGLGRHHDFVPNFDLNQMVRNKLRGPKWKYDKKRNVEDQKSRQFKKLQLAAQKVREKRENDRKIAELFAGKKKRSVKKADVDYEEPVVYSLG